MTPLFIFSLPRSGSTYLQKLLMTSSDVESISEPWILLPLLASQDKESIKSIYGQSLYYKAFTDVIETMPNGIVNWDLNINLYYKNVCKSISSNREAKYFLDKTPRYSIYAQQIIRTFPEAKFIVLTRNPVEIINSIIRSWYNNQWKMSSYVIDFKLGLKNLIEIKNFVNKNIMFIKYEDLIDPIKQPEELEKIEEYLGVSLNTKGIDNVKLTGNLGDKEKYRVNKDKEVVCNIIRYYYIINLLKNIGETDLNDIGMSLVDFKKKYRYKKYGYKYLLADIIEIVKNIVRKYVIVNKKGYILY